MPTQSDIGVQLSAFSHAPIPYIAEAILVAMLVWFLNRSINKGVVDALRERLSLAIDRLKAANDEADAVRRNLEDLRHMMPSISTNTQAEATTSSAQSGIMKLVQANARTISFLSGEMPAAPASSSGPAARPDAPR